MSPNRSRFPFFVGAVFAAIALASTMAAASLLHFDLAKSSPIDEATVHMVPEVTLWFTEAPSDGSVSIRLIDSAGEPIEGLTAAVDEEDGRIFHLPTPDGLAPGAYTVTWRGMGGDGHVVRGDFGFTVASH